MPTPYQVITATPDSRERLKRACVRIGFRLDLSQAQIEFLAAVTGGVRWNRSAFGPEVGYVDSYAQTSAALAERGLTDWCPAPDAADDARDLCKRTSWVLTVAGEAMVIMLLQASVFVRVPGSAPFGGRILAAVNEINAARKSPSQKPAAKKPKAKKSPPKKTPARAKTGPSAR